MSGPPREFPPAPEHDPGALPMWLFWVYVAALAFLVGARVWTALS